MIRATFFALILLLFSNEAVACTLAIADRSVPADELIDRTKNIVLARVIKAEYLEPKKVNGENEDEVMQAYVEAVENLYQPVKYTFEVFDLIKGKSQKFFFMKSKMLYSSGELEHFNIHKDKNFWENNGGSFGVCSHDQRAFAVGSFYLMFLDKPYHRKSFERIVNFRSDDRPNPEDKWLNYVKAKVSEQQ